MIILGIESTAHTFGIGIIDDKGNILANERDMFAVEDGGIIPVLAAEHHIKICDKLIKKAFKKSNLSIKDIDLIAFSQGPGLGHTLRVGAVTARTLSFYNNIPLIGVNHCIAHLEIGKLTGAKDPVLLYASGVNTQIIAFDSSRYRIFGETLDNGIGNFLDSFARELGLGFPGGPKIEELAKEGKNYIELPYTVKGMDVSFGGLLTNLKQKLKKYPKEDLAYSAQETVFAMLIEVTERAMAHCNKDELLLGGGVSCNKRLQEMANIMCRERGAKCFIPDNSLLVDNGAMIAWLGYLMHKAGAKLEFKETNIKPYERTDEVEVNWKN